MGGFVGEVVSFIGRPFGIHTHDKTFTDIQISNLITPGEADSSARKNCKHNAKGDSQLYMKAYRTFQRDYRKKYSAQFMKRQGYAPSSTAYTRINDEAKTALYLESLYRYADVNVESSRDKYLTINEKGRHAIQTLAGYEWATGNVLDGGTYILSEYTEDTVDTTVVVHMRRDYAESIEANLYANYAYDGVEVTIAGEQYTVGALSSSLNINDAYETICTHVGGTLSDEVIFTAAERKAYNVSNPAYGTEASYASYRVTSGEVGTELRYWVDLADTRDIYSRTNVDITAIIPMKENNVMVDLETKKLAKMLGKLNLSGEQLKSSIENPDMDSAYLMTGINPQYNDNTMNATLLKTFDYLAESGANITVSINQLSMKYSFGMNKSTVSGSIGPVGTATKTNIAKSYTYDNEGNATITSQAGMVLRLQVDTNEYKEIVVTNFIQEYTISGHGLTSYLDSTGGYTRIVIPLDILNSLTYKDFVHLYERSLCMLAFSTETVRVQWYETRAFGILIQLVAIVLMIMSGGASSAFTAAVLEGAVTIAATLGVLITLSMYHFIVTVGVLLVQLAISELISMLAEKIGGAAGAIVAAVVAAYVGYSTGTITMDFGSAETWIYLANETLGTYNQYIQNETAAIMNDHSRFVETVQEDIDYFKNKLEELGNDPSLVNSMTYAGVFPEGFNSIESYVNKIVSTTVEPVVDYSSQIDYNIHIRTNVVSGTG